jgi:hypothetical protein
MMTSVSILMRMIGAAIAFNTVNFSMLLNPVYARR